MLPFEQLLLLFKLVGILRLGRAHKHLAILSAIRWQVKPVFLHNDSIVDFSCFGYLPLNEVSLGLTIACNWPIGIAVDRLDEFDA